MKNLLLVVLACMSIGFATAQDLTKKELKALKKEMKSLGPVGFQKMKDDATAVQQKASELQTQVTSLESEKLSLENKNAELQNEVSQVKKKLEEAGEQQKVEQYTTYEGAASKGIIYKVQVGAFKGLDLRNYIGKHKNFSGEVGEDGLMRYNLGEFRDYWEADKFKKYLRDMGVKGAWISSYKDGKRVDIKEALEGTL